jgi:hypothetical protein
MTLCVSWGRSAPEGTNNVAAWGARAIFANGCIDLLPDRQGAAGDQAALNDLIAWVNKIGLPYLREEVVKVSRSSSEVVNRDDSAYHIEASPQSSHGYLYIGAWKLADVHQHLTTGD